MSSDTTEIKVIESVADIPIAKLSDVERQSIFERVAAEMPDIPDRYFVDFHDNLTETLKYIANLAEPEILEIKLRKLIELSRKYTPVIPILENLEQNVLIRRHKTHGYRPSQSRIRGGAAMVRPEIEKERRPVDTKNLTALSKMMQKKEIAHKLRIIFDWVQPAMRIDESEVVIASGDNVFVVGLQILAPMKMRNHIGDLLAGRFRADELVMECDKIIGRPIKLLKPARMIFTERMKQIIYDLYTQIVDGYKIIRAGILHPYISLYWKHSGAARRFLTPVKIREVEKEWVKPSAGVRKFIDQISGLLNIAFIDDVDEIYNEIIVARLQSVYYIVLLHGANDKRVLTFLDGLRRKNALIAAQSEDRRRRMEHIDTMNLYHWVIEQKLGEKKYNDIYKGKFYATIAAMLQRLSPAERKIVEEEYIRRKNFVKAAAANKCPHVRLLSQVRLSKSNFALNRYLRDLEKFFDKKSSPDKFIRCNYCGFDIMCPHVLVMLKSTLSHDTFQVSREKLSPFIMMKPGSTSYFCKICGENISDVDIPAVFMTEDTAAMQHSIDDELRRKIWSEMVSILQRVRFTIVINPIKIIDAMITATYEFIFEIEKQLLKSRTNTPEDVRRRLSLFITIYGYTYLVHLVQANMKKPPLEFKGMKPSTNIVDYLKFVISDITNTRNILLSKIGGLSSDFVKNKVIEAFKAIGTKGEQQIRYSDVSEGFYSSLVLDPFYFMMHMYYSVNAELTRSKISLRSPNAKHVSDRMSRVEQILGDSIDALAVTTDTMYAKVRPLGWKQDVNFPSYQMQSAKELSRIWYAGVPAVRAASFNFTLDWVKKRAYMQSWYNETEYSAIATDIDGRADKLKAAEKILLDYKSAWRFRSIGYAPSKLSMHYVWRDVGLGLRYGINGHQHVFDVYVYDKGKISLVDANANLQAGKGMKYEVSDRICSICGVSESKAHDLDNEKIRNALENKSIVENFLRMYETRCPVEGVHEYIKGICRKCGMPENIRETPEKASQFVEKYRKVYEKDLKRAYAFPLSESTGVIRPTKPLPKSLDEYVEQYSYKYEKIVELNSKLKTNVHAFVAIGATENIEYADIMSGKYIAPEPEEKSSHHIYKVVSYVYMLIREYNQLRHSATLKLGYDLQTIIDKSGIKKNDLSQLGKLSSIAEHFTEILGEMAAKKVPKRILEFAIESLAVKLLTIYTLKDPVSESVRRGFVEYFVKKILRSEELTSLADFTQWALFRRGEQEEEETYNSNYDYEHGLETEEALDRDKEENEDYGSTDEVFGMDAFDIDIVEGAPDDLDDNDVKTEGYGLD